MRIILILAAVAAAPSMVPTALRAQSPPPAIAQALTGAAQWADSARREIEAAFIDSDADRLARARITLDRALAAYPRDALLLHYMGYALYREATLRDATRERPRIDTLLVQAEDYLQRSGKVRPMAETNALLANVIGRQLARNPAAGATLGPRIGEELERAARLGPSNPRVFLMMGTNTLYSPVAYGGGPRPARKYLERAITLFELDRPATPAPAWGRAEARAWLGVTYAREDQFDRARQELERALVIEPNYRWVRVTVLPQLERKAAAKQRAGTTGS